MEKRARGASAGPPDGPTAGSEAPAEVSRRSPKRRRSAGVDSVKTGGERGDSPPPVDDPLEASAKRRKEAEGEQEGRTGGRPAPAEAQGIALSARTTREMDAFVARCAQWQARLTDLARVLAAQVARVEQQQVAAALRDAVVRVELADREARVRDAEMEQRWTALGRQDADAFADALARARGGAQEFEAMERQLVADRVLELETQLQQKRANERDKEHELATLRADHDALLRASAEASKSELDKLAAERDALRARLLEAKAKYKHKAEQAARLKDEVLNYKFQNEDLLDECHALRGKSEELARDAERRREEVDALKEQLEAARQRSSGEEEALEEDKERIQAEAEERGERIELLATELQRVQSALAAATADAAAKTSEVSRLQGVNAELERRLAAAAPECEARAKECHEADSLGADGVRRKSSGEAASSRSRSPPSPSPSKKRRREDPSPTAVDRLAPGSSASVAAETAAKRQAEKELLQAFFKRYYRAAEKKCGDLMRQVSHLEERAAARTQRARESLDALRACAQADTWDDAARSTLLAVVTSLERSVS